MIIALYPPKAMKLILFFFFICAFQAVGLGELKSLYRSKNYQQILDLYRQDPASFSRLPEMEILGLTYRSLGDHKKAIRVCAQVIEEKAGQICTRLLRELKQENPNLYHSEIGWFFMERGDAQSAFAKFYPLVRKFPADHSLRKALTRVFQSMRQYDHMLEQIWQMEENEESKSLLQWLKLVTYKLRKRLAKQDLDLINETPDSYYLFLFLTQKTHPYYFEPLLSHYKELFAEGGSEEDQLRYANLLQIGGKLKESRIVTDQLEKTIAQPIAVLSLESLLKRLPPKPKPVKEGEEEGENPQGPPNEEMKRLVEVMEERDSVEEGPVELYAPFDFSELKMATLANLKPFRELHMSFQRKLSLAKSPRERRWVFEKVREKLMEMDSSHLDPNKHPVERYFERTEDGKKFGETLETLRKEALEMDRKNSRRYEGELDRVRSGIQSAKSQKERKKILTKFYYQWKMIAENSFTDPRVRGAWEYYIETAEGTRLLNYVQEEVKKLGLQKSQTPFTRIWQY